MRSFVVLLLVSLSVACQKKRPPLASPYSHLKNPTVRSIIQRAIDHAGGIAAWKNVSSIQYTKRSRLIQEGNVLEYDITQSHSYEMHPTFSAEINWLTDTIRHKIIHGSENSVHLINEVDGDYDPQKVEQSVMSALFVLGMPFKLLDKGVNLSYEGQELFMDSVKSDVIKATYDPVAVDTHSTSDVWWFYFDSRSGAFLGSKVYHAPTYALIHNIAFTKDIPLKFPTRRKSYRVDSLGNIQFLRAEFWYSDFEVVD